MPVKLIGTLIIAVVAMLFTGFNLDNKCDVWLFHKFESVPVAVTIVISLLAGVIITLPFTFGRRVKKDEMLVKKSSVETKSLEERKAPSEKKKGFFKSRKETVPAGQPLPESGTQAECTPESIHD